MLLIEEPKDEKSDIVIKWAVPIMGLSILLGVVGS